MGQYYRGAVLGITANKKKKFIVKQAFSPYRYDNGAKLMEHSYVGNYYVKRYEYELANEFNGYPFVWIGDYADYHFNEDDGYTKANEFIDKIIRRNAIKKGYRVETDSFGNDMFFDGVVMKHEHDIDIPMPYEELPTYKYIINYTKKQFVRIPNKVEENKLVIHPLPLLCADGNGRGGGDYSGTNMDAIGMWAYDRIGVSNEIPKHIKTELVISFKEEYDGGDETLNDFTYRKIK